MIRYEKTSSDFNENQIQVTSWGIQKGGDVTFFSCFQNNFISYHKEVVTCWPGWYFICLVIYLTTIDNNFISIPFIYLAIFNSMNEVRGGVFLQIKYHVKLNKFLIYTALHTHILTNAKSVWTFEMGIILW